MFHLIFKRNKCLFSDASVEHSENSDKQAVTDETFLNALIIELLKRLIKISLVEASLRFREKIGSFPVSLMRIINSAVSALFIEVIAFKDFFAVEADRSSPLSVVAVPISSNEILNMSFEGIGEIKIFEFISDS